MKVVEIVPRERTRLYEALVAKEEAIRKGGRGTYVRVGRKRRDAARYMAAMRELKLGDSTPETHHKIVYAGLKSGVVREARVPGRAEPLTPKDVGDLVPKVVRWFAVKINSLYVKITAIPPE